MLSGVDRRSRRQALCLAHIPAITSEHLSILETLREAFLSPDIVDGVLTLQAACDIERTANFILARCPTLEEIVLAAALRSGGTGNMRGVVERMLGRHGVLDVPFVDDEDFVFLRRCKDVVTLGQRHRNCLGSKTIECSLGLIAYAVWRHQPFVIAELRRLHDGDASLWICEGLHGHANDPVPTSVCREITRRLRACGVLTLTQGYSRDVAPSTVEEYTSFDPVLFLGLATNN